MTLRAGHALATIGGRNSSHRIHPCQRIAVAQGQHAGTPGGPTGLAMHGGGHGLGGQVAQNGPSASHV
eukprot:g2765.t1